MRNRLKLNGTLISTLGQLREVLGIAEESWDAMHGPFRDDCTFIDALVAVNKRKSPGFLIEKRREDSRMFAFCRALCETWPSIREPRAWYPRRVPIGNSVTARSPRNSWPPRKVFATRYPEERSVKKASMKSLQNMARHPSSFGTS